MNDRCAACGAEFETYGALLEHYAEVGARAEVDENFIAHYPPYPYTPVTWAARNQQEVTNG